MNEIHSLKWLGGEINISTLGCMMMPNFKIGGNLVRPLHAGKWINDKTKEYNELPGILKNLSGEFPCVPFGINSPIEEITKVSLAISCGTKSTNLPSALVTVPIVVF